MISTSSSPKLSTFQVVLGIVLLMLTVLTTASGLAYTSLVFVGRRDLDDKEQANLMATAAISTLGSLFIMLNTVLGHLMAETEAVVMSVVKDRGNGAAMAEYIREIKRRAGDFVIFLQADLEEVTRYAASRSEDPKAIDKRVK